MVLTLSAIARNDNWHTDITFMECPVSPSRRADLRSPQPSAAPTWPP